jgi:non-ribosomal peptide synthetase component F
MDTKTNFNLAAAIHRHSLSTPDALAVACQGRSLSYAELAERSARIGACLAARTDRQPTGAQPPRVGILASRGVDACVAVYSHVYSELRVRRQLLLLAQQHVHFIRSG